MEYIARLSKAGRRTLVNFPDCSGCQTFADSRAAALSAAHQALEGWLETMLDYGEAPPEPKFGRGRSADRVAIRVKPTLAVRLQLRWARQKRGLSQAGLAKLVGVTRQQISQLESPDANLRLSTLDRVARALGMQVEIELQPSSSAA